MFHWCLKQNKCLELELLSNFLFEPWASDSSVGWLWLVSEICCLLHPAHSWHVTPPGLSIPPSAEPQHANKAPLQPPILKYNRAGARGCSLKPAASALRVQIMEIILQKGFFKFKSRIFGEYLNRAKNCILFHLEVLGFLVYSHVVWRF